MLSLGAPLALIALTALVIPVAIHLIRKPVPTVRLGSLKFLHESQRRLRSLRWRDLLLLAVRCGLLAVLALFLAAPRWVPSGSEPVRWVLRIPGVTLDAEAERRLQALTEEGFAPRYLAPGFPVGEPTVLTGPTDAWSLLREADLSLPTGSEWVVIAPPRTEYFVGDRPVLRRLRVTWVPSASDERGETREAETAPPLRSPVRVAIHASPDRSDDERIVRAAMNALIATDRPLVEVTENPDWIFHLGSRELPPAWLERVRQGATLVTDGPDETLLTPSRTFRLQGRTYPLLRRSALPALERPEAMVVADSVGDPMVTLSRIGAGRHLRFALRFHPDTTSWVLASTFPAWWAEQLLGEPASSPPQGWAEPLQIEPRTEMGPVSPPPLPRPDAVDLRTGLWVLAVLLFMAERWMAHRSGRGRSEVPA